MSVISTLPKWASAPLTKLANKEPVETMQRAPLDQDSFDEISKMAVGLVTMASNDEVPGVDKAMGQPGVVSPQDGVTLRFEGDPSDSTGEVRAVLDASDQGAAVYVRSGADGFDTFAVMKTPEGVMAQGGYVQASPMGIGGYLVAGPVA